MGTSIYRFLIAIGTTIIILSWSVEGGFVRQCYFPSWTVYRPDKGKFGIDNIDFSGCTIIDYAFAQITNNQLATFDWQDEKNFAELVQKKISFPNLRIHLSVGGWTLSKQFPPMAASVEGRTTFVTSCIANLRRWNLDGLDVDWEYPEAADRQNFQSLIRELRQGFEQEAKATGKTRLGLTAAVASVIKAGYVPEEMAKYLDMVNVMTYDYHGAWEQVTGHNAPFPAVQTSMNTWAAQGIPKNKLAMGIGFYGRSWTLANAASNGVGAAAPSAGPAGPYTREPGTYAYYEACDMLKSGGRRVWDANAQVPYLLSGTQWVSYDDAESIRIKTKWGKENEFAGVLIWDLSQDDFPAGCGQKNALLAVVSETAASGENSDGDEEQSDVWAASLADDLLTAGPSDAEQEHVEDTAESLAVQPHSRGEMLKPDGDPVLEEDIVV